MHGSTALVSDSPLDSSRLLQSERDLEGAPRAHLDRPSRGTETRCPNLNLLSAQTDAGHVEAARLVRECAARRRTGNGAAAGKYVTLEPSVLVDQDLRFGHRIASGVDDTTLDTAILAVQLDAHIDPVSGLGPQLLQVAGRVSRGLGRDVVVLADRVQGETPRLIRVGQRMAGAQRVS